MLRLRYLCSHSYTLFTLFLFDLGEMHRATIVVITLYTLFGELYSSDCNEGYCLPPPENFVQGVNTKSQRTLSVSSLCGQNGDYSYVKFPDTGKLTNNGCQIS